MNLILATDSYKLTHFKQYPPKTQRVYSYLESRGGMFPNTTFFGLQYYLKKYLAGKVIRAADIEDADKFAAAHFGRRGCFNYVGWYDLLNKWGGYLPVEIKAVPEGTTVPTGNVLMTIENTDSEFPWLTNYLETLLLKVWYPTTVCTLSRHIKQSITKFHHLTGSDPAGVNFKLHDFGYRGVSSEESAAIGGAAHLVNFLGSDTIAGNQMAQKYYGALMAGFSIPAAEHSTITSWGKEHEVDAYRNMLTQWPDGLVAVVSDSYDLEHAVEDLWGGELRDEVLQRDGTVVIRPDSGDPVENVLLTLNALESKFGATRNDKGFLVLPSQVRVIQGDGINYASINQILAAVAKNGFAAENVAFGMGGALLQQLDRDTQKFAIKCSSITIDGQQHDVFKEAPGKASKRGRLALTHDGKDFRTIQRENGLEITSDILQTVFVNGSLTSEQTWDTIRQRAQGGI